MFKITLIEKEVWLNDVEEVKELMKLLATSRHNKLNFKCVTDLAVETALVVIVKN